MAGKNRHRDQGNRIESTGIKSHVYGQKHIMKKELKTYNGERKAFSINSVEKIEKSHAKE